MIKDKPSAEQVVLEIMRHFGFRRNYQVAEYFDVMPQTLSGWIKSGEIPPKHMIKYTTEVLGQQDQEKKDSFSIPQPLYQQVVNEIPKSRTKISFQKIIKNNFKILIGLPIGITSFMIIYVFLIADPVYTSMSKVLPISDDGGSTSGGFSGVAAQLGINIPLNLGGTVPWDEVYSEIVLSSNLLSNIMNENFDTKKYGTISLMKILVSENSLNKFSELQRKSRALTELRKIIKLTKDRLSPVVTLEVATFEPIFAAQLSKRLIEESGKIQRQLKTNRVRQKRLFIEERLSEVYFELQSMEKALREFREYNRNVSSSPSLQMKAQEMGREIELQNSLYVTLKTQHEKAKIDEVERDDMVQIIDGPNIPANLTSPRRLTSIILSLFFGIFLTSFIIYFRENYIDINPN